MSVSCISCFSQPPAQGCAPCQWLASAPNMRCNRQGVTTAHPQLNMADDDRGGGGNSSGSSCLDSCPHLQHLPRKPLLPFYRFTQLLRSSSNISNQLQHTKKLGSSLGTDCLTHGTNPGADYPHVAVKAAAAQATGDGGRSQFLSMKIRHDEIFLFAV